MSQMSRDTLQTVCEAFLEDLLSYTKGTLRKSNVSPSDWVDPTKLPSYLVPGTIRIWTRRATKRAIAELDKQRRRAGHQPRNAQELFDDLLWPFAIAYIRANDGSLTFKKRLCARHLRHLEARVANGVLQRHVAILENFRSNTSRLRIDRALTIELLTDRDRTEFEGVDERLQNAVGESIIGVPGWCIAEEKRGFSHDIDQTEMRFQRLLLAMRLLKPEILGYRVNASYSKDPLSLGGRYRNFNQRPLHFATPSYLLRPSDGVALRQIWKAVSTQAVHEKYAVALRRFSETYFGRANEDKLIDAWIGLENIFMPDKDTRESTYRISLRIAYALGQTPRERENLDIFVRKSYGLRSDIVHGRKLKQADLTATVDQTIHLLRSALRIAFAAKRPLDMDDLDRAVRSGVRPRSIS